MSLYDDHANDGRGGGYEGKPKKKVATLQSKKEQVWNATRKFPIDSDFIWLSASNDYPLRPAEMPVPHIVNALRKVMKNFINELLNRGFDKDQIKQLLTENLTKL